MLLAGVGSPKLQPSPLPDIGGLGGGNRDAAAEGGPACRLGSTQVSDAAATESNSNERGGLIVFRGCLPFSQCNLVREGEMKCTTQTRTLPCARSPHRRPVDGRPPSLLPGPGWLLTPARLWPACGGEVFVRRGGEHWGVESGVGGGATRRRRHLHNPFAAGAPPTFRVRLTPPHTPGSASTAGRLPVRPMTSPLPLLCAQRRCMPLSRRASSQRSGGMER